MPGTAQHNHKGRVERQHAHAKAETSYQSIQKQPKTTQSGKNNKTKSCFHSWFKHNTVCKHDGTRLSLFLFVFFSFFSFRSHYCIIVLRFPLSFFLSFLNCTQHTHHSKHYTHYTAPHQHCTKKHTNMSSSDWSCGLYKKQNSTGKTGSKSSSTFKPLQTTFTHTSRRFWLIYDTTCCIYAYLHTTT